MKPRCGAQTETGPCRRFPKDGRLRCVAHGGAEHVGRPPSRPDAWAKALGPMWDAVASDALRSLDTDLAICLARERELIEQLEEGDSAQFRARARELFAGIRAAIAAGNGDGIRSALTELEDWLADGCDRTGVWDEVAKNSDRKAALTEKAVTIETKQANALTGRAVVNLLGTVFDLVRLEVGDDVAYRVGQRFRETFARQLRSDAAEAGVALGPALDGG